MFLFFGQKNLNIYHCSRCISRNLKFWIQLTSILGTSFMYINFFYDIKNLDITALYYIFSNETPCTLSNILTDNWSPFQKIVYLNSKFFKTKVISCNNRNLLAYLYEVAKKCPERSHEYLSIVCVFSYWKNKHWTGWG